MNHFSIRNASATDAELISRLSSRLFDETFRDSNSRANMDAFLGAVYSTEKQRKELQDPSTRVFLLAKDSETIGLAYLKSGAVHKSVSIPNALELCRFYIDQKFHGSGAAQFTLQHLIQTARALKADGIWLGVWEENHRAIRFYEKLGFVKTGGEQVFNLGNDPQRDLVMQLKIEA